MLVVTDPEEVARFCNNSNKQANLPKWAETYLVLEPVSFAMFCVLLSMQTLTTNMTAKACTLRTCVSLDAVHASHVNFDHVLAESATLLIDWYTRL